MSICLKEVKTLIQKDTCTPMLIAILHSIDKIRKQPKCQSMDAWIKKMWYIYIYTYIHTHTQWNITLPLKE